jgi:hypothetical protein
MHSEVPGTAAVDAAAAAPAAGVTASADWENQKMEHEDAARFSAGLAAGPLADTKAAAGLEQHQQQEEEEDEDVVPLGELPDLPDCPPLRDENQAGLQKHESAVAEMVSYLFGGRTGKQGSSAAAATAAAATEGEAVRDDVAAGMAADQ